MGKYIDKVYLASLWGRIKQIPTQVSYTIDNASKTLVSAINDLYTGKADKEHTHMKSSIMDFPTSLPANGGNADTLDDKHATDFALADSSFTKEESYIYNGKYSSIVNIPGTYVEDRNSIKVYKLYLLKATTYEAEGEHFSFSIQCFGGYNKAETYNTEEVEYQGVSYSGWAREYGNNHDYTRRLTHNGKTNSKMAILSDLCYTSEDKRLFIYIVVFGGSGLRLKIQYNLTGDEAINKNAINPSFSSLPSITNIDTEITTYYGETVKLSDNRYKYDCVTRSCYNFNDNFCYTKYLVYSDEPNPIISSSTIAVDILSIKDTINAISKDGFSYNTTETSLDVASGYMGKDGRTYDTSNFCYTQKISVNSGDKIFANNNAELRFITAFNGNTVIPSKSIDQGGYYSYDVPDGIDGLVISLRSNEVNSYTKIMIYGKSNTKVIKISYELEQELNKASNILYGKKWAVFGDSFTEASGVGVLEEGKYKGENKSYCYFIGNRNNMTIQKFFASGRTIVTPRQNDSNSQWSYNSNRNYITLDSMYQNVDNDVNYITIYIGINDSHLISSVGNDNENYGTNVTADMGTIDSTDITTFYGAWNTMLQWLIENRPKAKIGIIVSNGCDTDEYREAEIAIAKKWGIPYIDLNGDERTPMMLRSSNPNHLSTAKLARTMAQSINYPSNQHPNADAYEYESSFIEAFLRTL